MVVFSLHLEWALIKKQKTTTSLKTDCIYSKCLGLHTQLAFVCMCEFCWLHSKRVVALTMPAYVCV